MRPSALWSADRGSHSASGQRTCPLRPRRRRPGLSRKHHRVGHFANDLVQNLLGDGAEELATGSPPDSETKSGARRGIGFGRATHAADSDVPFDPADVGPLRAIGVVFEPDGVPSAGTSRTRDELRTGTDLSQ
jgi:hypothetical protein